MFLAIPIISKSGRVALSAPAEADDEAVAALGSDPATRRFLRFLPERISVEDIRARRISQAVDPAVVAFNIHALKLGRQPTFVGMTTIFRIDHYYGNSCEVGVVMSQEHFGTGLASDAIYTVLEYAFEERKFRRVVFHTAVDNMIIRGWIERIGGGLEGIQRDCWSDGKGGYTDVCLYSMLDKEWVGGCKAKMEQGRTGGAHKSRL